MCSSDLKSKLINIIIKELNIQNIKDLKTLPKYKLCDIILNKLIELEKYSNDNYIYIYIPKKHPDYTLPINIKDRLKYWTQDIQKIFNYKKITEKIITNNKENYIEFNIDNIPQIDIDVIKNKYKNNYEIKNSKFIINLNK